MAILYTSFEDEDILSITCILGVKPDHGLINDLNEMHTKGLLKNTQTIGDIVREYLKYKLQYMEKLESL